ncbi:stage V sporulation protein SpoVM [Aneurinibacillus migulanus]|nr:stage V sporulation protein SpoVM [Aneurinibacillus migulanus]MCP1355647.1 stage V sporulation protein SpoVM [Aneurinibacillus migulanus]MED0891781.1 stage V sporulation protein SpoVM [Aneurinibacillus migulanus]MED1617479.1 stage V sporulation protein SpoVM [Aneurinibacillus migulanus]MED4726709.1 stage V sporulation protein SpoVM [Aneurinibacillus migulanus]
MLNRAIRSTQPVHLNIMELYLNMGGVIMRFYTIKLPKFLGGLIRAILGGGKR